MARVESSSCCTTAPSRVRPANAPFEREYVSTWVFIFQSVPADAWRPTGPAAADPSPVSWNLLERRCWKPWSFMTSMTKSTPSTPICNPQLPPPTETNAGALQPADVRQEATPRPCLAPKMNPPLIKSGTTRMHFALLNTSSGIPLSGADIIAWRTSTDFCRRSTVSSRVEPANAYVPAMPTKLITSSEMIFFMNFPFRGHETKRRRLQMADLAQRT